jgi:hypothetical protein
MLVAEQHAPTHAKTEKLVTQEHIVAIFLLVELLLVTVMHTLVLVKTAVVATL